MSDHLRSPSVALETSDLSNLEALAEKIRSGATFVITNGGKPCAIVSPFGSAEVNLVPSTIEAEAAEAVQPTTSALLTAVPSAPPPVPVPEMAAEKKGILPEVLDRYRAMLERYAASLQEIAADDAVASTISDQAMAVEWKRDALSFSKGLQKAGQYLELNREALLKGTLNDPGKGALILRLAAEKAMEVYAFTRARFDVKVPKLSPFFEMVANALRLLAQSSVPPETRRWPIQLPDNNTSWQNLFGAFQGGKFKVRNNGS